MTRTVSQRLAYQPALDGLRAVAVVAVILFHNGVSWMPGGFLGVDVFFVLSGYLITTLLLLEWHHPGGVDLGAFWLRRIRRLLPALLLVLVAVAAYGRWVADPVTLGSLRWDSLASLGYVANWRFIFSHQSYFEAFAAPSPLRHVWSLAVEEQWYLFWPVFLSVGLSWCRKSIKPLLFVMVALTALSVGEMAWLTWGSGDPSRAYYGTDTRAHTLLVGAILAVLLKTWPVRRRPTRIAVQLLGAGGLVAVGAFLVMVKESDRWMYHGGFLLLALCTAAVIAAAMLSADGLVKRMLRLRGLPAIGRLSYGLYLWHWPVNVWLTPERLGLEQVTWGGVRVEGYLILAIRVLVTVVVSLLSYKLVELPVRHGALGRIGQRVHGSLPVGGAMTFGAVGVTAALVFGSTAGAPSTLAAGSRKQPDALAGHAVGVPKSASTSAVTTVPLGSVRPSANLPAVAADRPVKLAMAGDSAAWTLTWLQPHPLPDLQIEDRAIIGCGVVDTPYFIHSQRLTFTDDCSGQPEYWQQSTPWQPDVMALMVGAWEVYDHEVDGKRVGPGDASYAKRLSTDMINGVDKMLAANPNLRLAFIGQACFAERTNRLGGINSERNDPKRLQWVNSIVKQVAGHYGGRAVYIDMGPFLCPGGKFKREIDGLEMRPDGVHFNEASAAVAWQWLGPQIIDFVRKPTL